MNLGNPFAYVQFIRVPQQLENRVRGASSRLGLASVLAAVLVAAALVALWRELTFVVLMEGACALALLVSGGSLAGGRACMSAGYVNLTLARQIRNLTTAFAAFTFVFALLAAFGIVMAATTSGASVFPLVAAGFLLSAMTVLTVVNAVVGRRFFPPSGKLLREHGASGQIVGPPANWGPHGAGPPR